VYVRTSLRFTEVRGDSAALDADTGYRPYGGGFRRQFVAAEVAGVRRVSPGLQRL
jgi:hypothetical protein